MGINQLPPQAYTRETLMQAFDWIKTQPRQVQDLASSTDALVSVYMQARRRAGNHGVTHPVSSQSFKQDLKNLAEGLRQFEDDESAAGAASAANAQGPANSPASAMPNQQLHQYVQQAVHQAVQQPMQQQAQPHHSPQQHQQSQPYHQSHQLQQPQHQQVQQHAPQPPYHAAAHHVPPMSMPRQPMYDSAVNHLDSKSLEVVRLVQARFNLSSENEALRMLISLGFEKVREIFPKS